MLPAYGLYTHIRANEIRSRTLVLGLFLLNLVVAYALALVVRAMFVGAPAGAVPGTEAIVRVALHDLLLVAPLTAAITLLWLAIAYHGHQALVAGVIGARPALWLDHPNLHRQLKALCIARGVTMPMLQIVDDPALNAYATGLNPQQYAITVTSGLVDALDAREMQAVLAHELTHIRNDDVRTLTLVVVVAGIFAFVARALCRLDVIFEGVRGEGKRAGTLLALLAGLMLIALAWILSRMMRFALSRTREYVADAGAVELTKDPDALISALLKIDGRGDLARAPSGVMEMCFDNPRTGFLGLLATHPSIDDRIDAIMRFAGGRLPELS